MDQNAALFAGVAGKTICWMSHTDYIEKTPADFTVTAHTPVCPVAAMECPGRKLYAVQFHPEVMHTVEGMHKLRTVADSQNRNSQLENPFLTKHGSFPIHAVWPAGKNNAFGSARRTFSVMCSSWG